jgi:hypothetical protein
MTLGLLTACSDTSGTPYGRRFAGLNTCSADGSVVLFEYANSQGSYDGLDNGPCKGD